MLKRAMKKDIWYFSNKNVRTIEIAIFGEMPL
ncbi:hypothetical protein BROSI_A2904 [Candidatus Brocadia sinica JPN1]|uniref:Uncharacterized protein n=1 Tax=Candidatus Brocadia sinica JPN1 TaxID=1197129 RepID=A0ABQ0K094_9BACT|nr:hypothetical protein BROSI_A2904 [Candidatus Brocadia sinica JPN1]